ncbi:hypothetical protein AB0K51_21945 [Kitasatospora sp. NPDC049285]|uniref:hypothetical protein n=1 Tax=Kitasatospora sp. NPDC049285 TaxID=3157096 RepID=UPI0034140656
MAGGSWWRDGGSAEGGGESVYLPRQAVDSPPAVPPVPGVPPQTPAVELKKPDPEPSGPTDAEVRRAAEYAEGRGRTDVTEAYPGWDAVYFDLPTAPPEPAAAPEPAAEPLTPAVPEPPAAPEPRPGLGRRALKALFGRPAPAADAPPVEEPAAQPGPGASRRPAPLLLLGATALLAGAVTGSLLAMLAGWGVSYLSRGLADMTRKFAVLGIPLATLTGFAVWNWGREQGRWGTALAPGSDAGASTWAGAPGALRVAAVITAVFLLVVTLRRRKSE